MIRLEFLRIGPVWLAINVNDYGKFVAHRLGFTMNHAASRCARAVARRVQS